MFRLYALMTHPVKVSVSKTDRLLYIFAFLGLGIFS